MNCIRFLGYKSLAEVDKLTIPEYELLMEGVQLRSVDEDYRNHLQAYLNFAVKATKGTKKNQRPVYSKFKSFFDYEKAINKIIKTDKKDRYEGIGKFLKKGE